jgi:hypothetical protein
MPRKKQVATLTIFLTTPRTVYVCTDSDGSILSSLEILLPALEAILIEKHMDLSSLLTDSGAQIGKERLDKLSVEIAWSDLDILCHTETLLKTIFTVKKIAVPVKNYLIIGAYQCCHLAHPSFACNSIAA